MSIRAEIKLNGLTLRVRVSLRPSTAILAHAADTEKVCWIVHRILVAFLTERNESEAHEATYEIYELVDKFRAMLGS